MLDFAYCIAYILLLLDCGVYVVQASSTILYKSVMYVRVQYKKQDDFISLTSPDFHINLQIPKNLPTFHEYINEHASYLAGLMGNRFVTEEWLIQIGKLYDDEMTRLRDALWECIFVNGADPAALIANIEDVLSKFKRIKDPYGIVSLKQKLRDFVIPDVQYWFESHPDFTKGSPFPSADDLYCSDFPALVLPLYQKEQSNVDARLRINDPFGLKNVVIEFQDPDGCPELVKSIYANARDDDLLKSVEHKC